MGCRFLLLLSMYSGIRSNRIMMLNNNKIVYSNKNNRMMGIKSNRIRKVKSNKMIIKIKIVIYYNKKG